MLRQPDPIRREKELVPGAVHPSTQHLEDYWSATAAAHPLGRLLIWREVNVMPLAFLQPCRSNRGEELLYRPMIENVWRDGGAVTQVDGKRMSLISSDPLSVFAQRESLLIIA